MYIRPMTVSVVLVENVLYVMLPLDLDNSQKFSRCTVAT